MLIDQILSFTLVRLLGDIWLNVEHVRNVGLKDADDLVIWRFAAAHDWTILTKDGDFHQMSLAFGAPPQVIWLRVGNEKTTEVAVLHRMRASDIDQFVGGNSALLVLDT